MPPPHLQPFPAPVPDQPPSGCPPPWSQTPPPPSALLPVPKWALHARPAVCFWGPPAPLPECPQPPATLFKILSCPYTVTGVRRRRALPSWLAAWLVSGVEPWPLTFTRSPSSGLSVTCSRQLASCWCSVPTSGVSPSPLFLRPPRHPLHRHALLTE